MLRARAALIPFVNLLLVLHATRWNQVTSQTNNSRRGGAQCVYSLRITSVSQSAKCRSREIGRKHDPVDDVEDDEGGWKSLSGEFVHLSSSSFAIELWRGGRSLCRQWRVRLLDRLGDVRGCVVGDIGLMITTRQRQRITTSPQMTVG